MKIIIEEDFDTIEVKIFNQFVEQIREFGIDLKVFICPENECTQSQSKKLLGKPNDIEAERKFYGNPEEE